VSKWKTKVHSKKVIVAVFLDLKRAFETLDRSLMMKKLNKYGIRGVEAEWFLSYLSNRTQRTKIGEEVSDKIEVKLGVPQGAVLGTLLFIIYINDIVSVLNHSEICLFADDTLLFVTGETAEECVRKMDSDLIKVQMYLEMNKLKLNATKTKAMVINGDTNLDIVVNNEVIEKVQNIKYLGVYVNNKLKFDVHIDYTCKKLAKKIGFLMRIRNKLDYQTAINIYNTIIKPHFEYCSTILYLGTNQMCERLQRLQNRAMRCILKCERLTHSVLMLDSLMWLSVKQKVVFNVMMFIFKIKNNMLPIYLKRQLINVSEVQPYLLRNNQDFRLPNLLSSASQNNLFYKGTKYFNSLPLKIKNEQNVIKFKKGLVEYIKGNVT